MRWSGEEPVRNECEELSRTQLVTRKLPVARKCESVAKLVTSLSSSIWCHSFSIGDDVQRLSVPKSADLVVIYNSDGRHRMLDPLAVHFHDFTLVSVLSGPHLTDNVERAIQLLEGDMRHEGSDELLICW